MSLVKADNITDLAGSGSPNFPYGMKVYGSNVSLVGEIKQFRKNTPISTAFPYFNLSLPTQVLSATTYIDYVPYLRSVEVEVPFSSLNVGQNQSDGSSTFTINNITGVVPTVGQWIAILSASSPSAPSFNNFQYRIVTNVPNATQLGVDEIFSLPGGSYVHLLNHSVSTSSFTGTIDASNTVFKLNLTNDAGSNSAVHRALFSALYDDYAFGFIGSNTTHNRFAEWDMTVSICPGSTWIEANAVERTITALTVNTNERHITLSGSNFTNGTYTIKIFPHRITGSTTTARHRQILDVHLGNIGLEVVSGLRRRDRMQGHRHAEPFQVQNSINGSLPRYDISSSATATQGLPITDGSNGSPRTDQFTQPRTLGVYYYEGTGRLVGI
jgi:hypothetical protein